MLKPKRLLQVNPLIFLVMGVAFGCLSIVALRHNNQQMEQLRSTLYSADKTGGDVQTALDNLQSYVTSHMNTNLSSGVGSVYPPIQLEYTYIRLAEAQNQQALNNNGGLYTAAQQYCQKLDPVDFSGHNRVPCIEQYVTSHGVGLTNIPPSLYEFDFISPSWSPDLAGWSLVGTVLFLTLSLLLYMRRLINRLVR